MIFYSFRNEYPKNEEFNQSEQISIFQHIKIAISLDWKKINAFCLFYSRIHSLGLQDIIMDNVVSKNHFLRNVHCGMVIISMKQSKAASYFVTGINIKYTYPSFWHNV